MRLFLGVLVVAAIALGLGWWVVGANPATVSTDRGAGGTYSGSYVEPRDFNPFTSLDRVVHGGVLRYTHDALFELDPQTAEPRAALASVEERSPDGLRVVLRLRDGLQWSDGRPLTTADVAFTYAVLRDPGVNPGRLGQAIAGLASLDVLDARRFRLTLTERHFAGFDSVVTALRPLQERWWTDEVARLARAADQAVPNAPGEPGFAQWVNQVALPGPASGPYRVGDWRRGDRLTLVRNPRSWRRAAQAPDGGGDWRLAAIELRFFADPAAVGVALRNQQIDWTVVDGDPRTKLERDPELARNFQPLTYDYLALGQYVVMWNCRREALRDPRVRRALTMLFDRDTLVDKVLTGVAVPATGWFKVGSPEYPRDLTPIPFDPPAARALLREAGFDPAAGRPLRVSMLRGNYPLHNRIMDLARPAFEQAGVELVDVVRSYDAYSELRDARDFDGLLASVSHDAHIDPYHRFHSSQADRGENFMGYANPDVDRLLDTARREFDAERRASLYRDFGSILHEEQPVTLLCHPLVGLLLHRRFDDVEIGPLGLRIDRLYVPAERTLTR